MLYHIIESLNDPDVIIKGLTSSFWDGKRWVVFDTSKKMLSLFDLECFCCYEQATQFCVLNSDMKVANKIVLLSRLLKISNNAPKNKFNKINSNYFFEALEQTTASLHGHFYKYIDCIERNDYFPLNKHQVINPLTHVEKYHVASVQKQNYTEKNDQVTYSQLDIHSSFDTFEKSLVNFKATTFGNYYRATNYLLIGQFVDKVLQLDNNGMPVGNTGITLFRSIMPKKGQKLQIEQVNDITSPFVLRYGIFAKYKSETKRLDCYDGALKKEALGSLFSLLDFSYYLFE
jgi:hypothetical protein